MRHVAHPHPALRAHILLLLGKLRFRQLQQLRASRNAEGEVDRNFRFGPESDDGERATAYDRALQAATADALKTALEVSCQRGGHDGRLMKDACMHLVLLNIMGSISHNHDDEVGDAATPDGHARRLKNKQNNSQVRPTCVVECEGQD